MGIGAAEKCSVLIDINLLHWLTDVYTQTKDEAPCQWGDFITFIFVLKTVKNKDN